MAVNEFNTIHQDVQVQLIFEDGKCNGKDATSAVQKLIDVDKVQLVLGGLCSSEMLASAQITQPLHIVNLSAVGQSPEINTIGDYVYKMTDTTNEIKSLNSYLEHNQIAKIGIIYENTDYGVSFVNLLKEAYKRAIIFESKYESSEKDFNLLVK
jgi:branched-chain amino acid transport system substrate-binding protein